VKDYLDIADKPNDCFKSTTTYFSSLANKNEKAKLFRNAESYFKEALEKLYLRDISSTEWQKRSISEFKTMSISGNEDAFFCLRFASFNIKRYGIIKEVRFIRLFISAFFHHLYLFRDIHF